MKHLHRAQRVGIVMALALAAAFTQSARGQSIIYVDDDAPAGGTGTSWGDALDDLQTALSIVAAARLADDLSPYEIRVAAGRYRPDSTGTLGDRRATFEILPYLTIRGGYRGVGTAGAPDDRDPVAFPTTLSGDLGGDDDSPLGGTGDNALHVVVVDIGNAPATLELLRIRGGNASVAGESPPIEDVSGGGIRIISGQISIEQCVFEENHAQRFGGAIWYVNESVLILQSEFLHNSSGEAGGALAGSASLQAPATGLTIANSRFVGNMAVGKGGALRLYSALDNQILINCEFIRNSSIGAGGAVHADKSSFFNCTFSENSAAVQGGAIAGQGLTVKNSVLWANSATTGSEIYFTGSIANTFGRNIIDNESSGGVAIATSAPGCCGIAIESDPLFADLNGPDGEPGTSDDNTRVGPGSAAVDAGANADIPPDTLDLDGDLDFAEPFALDLDLFPRRAEVESVVDSGSGGPPTVDLGAYEISACPTCPGDRIWQNLTGGDFNVPANWFPGVAGSGNTAIFEKAGSYTVQFTSDTLNYAARVRGSADITLDLNGWQYELGALLDQPIVVGESAGDDAALTVAGGLLRSDGGIIGQNADARGRVTLSGTTSAWTIQDDLIVGFQGDGSLRVENGAELFSIAGAIGSQTGSRGSVSISGAGSVWEAPFGVDVESGVLEVAEGGELVAGFGSFGGAFVFSDGLLTGDGVVRGALVNFGQVEPGAAASNAARTVGGALQVNGDYFQIGQFQQTGSTTGILRSRVGGNPTAPLADSLLVTGAADLAGGLIVEFEPGFDPVSGTLVGIELLSASQIFGAFDVALFPRLSNGEFLSFVSVAPASPPERAGAAVQLAVNTLSGDIQFDAPENATLGGGSPSDAVLADLNGDGAPELIVTLPDPVNPETVNGSIVILPNLGTAGNGVWDGFGAPIQVTTGVGVNPSALAIGDLDSNGVMDIVVANRGAVGHTAADTVSLLFDVTLAGVTANTESEPVGDEPRGVAVVDLDGDGVLDIAVANSMSDSVTLIFSNLSPSPVQERVVWPIPFIIPAILPPQTRPISLRPGDLDGVRSGDELGVVGAGRNVVSVVATNGSRSPVVTAEVGVDDDPVGIAVRDLNGDGLAEIVTVNRASSTISVIRNIGDSSSFLLAPAVSLPVASTPRMPTSLAVGDFDSDGDSDLVVVADGDQGGRKVRLFRNDQVGGQLGFAAAVEQTAVENALLARAGDVDGDSHDDIVTINETGLARATDDEVSTRRDERDRHCVADISGDGVVDGADLGLLLGDWATARASRDFNADGVVDGADLGILLGAWGACP